MGVTSPDSFRYPGGADAVVPHVDIKNLADDVQERFATPRIANATYADGSQADISNTGAMMLVRSFTHSATVKSNALIVINYHWRAAANAAGYDQIYLNGAAVGSKVRMGNNGSSAQVPSTLVAGAQLTAGNNTVALYASADAGGVYRSIVYTNVTVITL